MTFDDILAWLGARGDPEMVVSISAARAVDSGSAVSATGRLSWTVGDDPTPEGRVVILRLGTAEMRVVEDEVRDGFVLGEGLHLELRDLVLSFAPLEGTFTVDAR